MKLEPHRVGGERSARQSRPLDRTLAFLDPLLASAALVVEGDDPLRRSCHVGDDEADTRIKLSGMPFDLRNHRARLGRQFEAVLDNGQAMERVWAQRASPQSYAHVVAAFRHGLKEAGYVEGQNIAIEYRWGRSFCDDVSYGGAGHLHLQGARKR